jgi:transcriptional regulator with XRE-family HTH domain
LTPNELAAAVGADKSVISRWYSGTAPSKQYQERLAAIFGCERDSLFRHPDEYWLAKFLRGRSAQEIERIKATLEAAFPRKNSH